jgi:ubiquinol-cytochrome c reductase cytochrome c1 subunit
MGTLKNGLLRIARFGWAERGRRIAATGLLAVAALSGTAIASSEGQLDHAPYLMHDRASLQRGAALFVNHCMGCHGASFLRYNKLQEMGISEGLLKESLMFNATKVGERMLTSMSQVAGREWFGVAPPDLTLVARSRGEDWLYTYLRGFYRDSTRPTGWNNVVFPNVGMPHVLYQYQGGRELTIEEEKPVVDEKTQKVIGGEKVLTVFDENGEKTVKTEKLAEAPAHASHHQHFTAQSAGIRTAIEYDQMSADLVNFLSWAGEPAQTKRYRTGVWVLAYLVVLFALAYAMKRAFWKDVH